MVTKDSWVMRGVSKRLFFVICVPTVALALASIVFAVWSFSQLQAAQSHLDAATAQAAELKIELAKQQEADKIARAAEREAQKKRWQKEIWDDEMALAGFEATSIDNLYYRWAKTSEFTCGYFDCAYIYVAVRGAPCPNGVYAEAAIMDGDLAVGMANGVTAGLQNLDIAAIGFEDYVGGDSFKLTKLACN